MSRNNLNGDLTPLFGSCFDAVNTRCERTVGRLLAIVTVRFE
jgi:hypothetical protein